MSEAPVRARLVAVVRGRVQGVFFRAFVERRAAGLGLSGYVRNLPGGALEVQAEGNRDSLEMLLGYLHTGPSRARVDSVDISWGDDKGEFSGFKVKY